MNSTGRLISYAIIVAMIAAATPAWAQNRLDADAIKLWGGTYSTNCGNPTAPRLRVVSDALIVEQGNNRLTARNVQAAHSYFGNSPPPEYQVALVSEVRGSLQMLFIVYQDISGLYIMLDGGREVQAALARPCSDKSTAAATPPGGQPHLRPPQPLYLPPSR